jgi:hypothetical protein
MSIHFFHEMNFKLDFFLMNFYFLTSHLKGLYDCLALSGRTRGLFCISGRCPELFCNCLSGNIW